VKEKENLKQGRAQERLRRRYRPARVRILFVGEAPPASGRFFYQADSGLYRAMRDGFASVFRQISGDNFLEAFQALGCYLADLCGRPVDRLPPAQRKAARLEGEARLSRMLKRFKPEIVIAVARSISHNLRRARQHANWSGLYVELPYPGRWQRYRKVFLAGLVAALRKAYRPSPVKAFHTGGINS